MKAGFIDFLKSVRGSYGMVFFSNHTVFAAGLLLASFTDPGAGFSGLLSTVFAIAVARLMGLTPALIQNGTYTFNSLLTGLAMGAYFKLSGGFFLMLLPASALTLLVTAWLAARAGAFKIPFLSLPFIFSTWALLLNARAFGSGILLSRPLVPFLDAWSFFSLQLEAHLPDYLALYFKSMGTLFFQSHILAGFLIALGLFLHSRIASLLSFTGFFAGLLYFKLVHPQLNDHAYILTAFNYILVALGLGGYFLISSGASFLLVIAVVPLVSLLSTALSLFIFPYGLAIYSLPFSVVLIWLVALLNSRYAYAYFQPVYYQQLSPEKNLYAFRNYMERFHNHTAVAIHLPFFGEWTVSQGHNGDITHKSDWRYAWDFVVTDEHKRSFRYPGKSPADFYCYNLPVLAPADGLVCAIEDGVEDNPVGDVNMIRNWGNSIVIRHAEGLYSKLSHLKKDSFKVKPGDTVKKGDVLASCGNSGRSPEPHIHFQLQSSDYVGAPTLQFPISSYISKTTAGISPKFFETPAEGEVISRPTESQQLKKAFHLVPGMKLDFEITGQGQARSEQWEVMADAFNNAYLRCTATGAEAYFVCTDLLFYFTGFKGNRHGLLYYFYLGAYKVLLGEAPGLRINDKLPVETNNRGISKILQDLAAPFYIFARPAYQSVQTAATQETVKGIVSEIKLGAKPEKNIKIEIGVSEQKIKTIIINKNNRCITATSIS